jgi:hypothetical protein
MDYVLKKSRSDTDAKTGENLEKPLLTFRNSGTSISDFPKGSTKLPLEKSPLFRVGTLVVNDQKPIDFSKQKSNAYSLRETIVFC